MAITIDADFCLGCSCCIDACSTGALELIDYKAAVSEEDCTDCKSCMELCPVHAITS